MPTAATTERLAILERHHVIYLTIAFALSYAIWVGVWVLLQGMDAGDLLFNADLVWALFFDGNATSSILWLSLLSMLGVYGPMIAGIVATHLDPSVSLTDLWKRISRVKVEVRWYGLVVGIVLLVAGPAALIVALTTDMLPAAPGARGLVAFLVVFFVIQMLTSGTEEIGWRGYLNEKLRHGRDFWDTGWAVGIPWAAWHIPVVVMIFVQQGMVPAQIVGSLIGFGIGIVAAAILHAWFYEKTKSVFLNIFIHAIFNTLPLATVIMFENSPVAVVANLALWAVVILLKRREVPVPVDSERDELP